jgi:hypothetical protein
MTWENGGTAALRMTWGGFVILSDHPRGLLIAKDLGCD